jgi:DNA-binding transcriptional LysR family regulator
MRLSDRIGRNIKLHDLHVLIAVVQIGSMSKAAAILHTTQSAISRSIAELEQTFGVRLLDRSNQGVKPTKYGLALLSGGAAVFDDLRQTVKNIEFLVDPTVGEVRVGAPDPIIIGVLPAVINGLRRKYPRISIQVIPVVPNELQFRDLRERNIDFLFGRILPRLDDDIQSEVLFHDRLVIAAGPGCRWARQRNVDLSALAGKPWALQRRDTFLGPLIADAFRALGLKFPPIGAVEGPSSLISALLANGPFLSTFLASVLQFGPSLPRLKVLPVDLPVPPWPTGIMMLANRTRTPVVQLFIDCARQIVKPLANESYKSARTR